jgi:hypothetical protein
LILRKTIEGGQHDAAELNNGHIARAQSLG